MHKDLIVAKLRENCRVGKYLLDSMEHLKKSIVELDEAIDLLSAVHYDDEVEAITALKKNLEDLLKSIGDKSNGLSNEAMALTGKLERMGEN